MNVRKNIDYSDMFAALDALMATNLPQMEMYHEIGRLVSDRREKGAAVSSAEYLQSAYPDMIGFSPRNLRRMREFYRAYASVNANWKMSFSAEMECHFTAVSRRWICSLDYPLLVGLKPVKS